jgi:hypothetical protein
MNERKGFLTYFVEMLEQYRADRRQNGAAEGSASPGRTRRLLSWFMPNGGTILIVLALIFTQQVWGQAALESPEVPGPSATTVNYQGRLADNNGNPINGTRTLQFAIYDAAASGNVVWGPETHANVPISEGLFSVGLGSLTSGGIPTNTWDGDRYLQITVSGEALTPRELIRSVPIAGMALTVPDGAIGTDQIEDASVQSRDIGLTTGRVVANIPDGSSMNLTANYQDVPGTSITLMPETAQTYLIYVTTDLSAVNATVGASIFIDGIADASHSIFQGSSGSVERGTVTQTYLVNLSPGTHTLILKAKLFSGTSGSIWETHTTITYFTVSQ